MLKSILSVEAFWVCEKQAKLNKNKTKENYKVIIEGLETHFFLPKTLQFQSMSIHRSPFNPKDSNILKFICCVKDMVYYLQAFPHFGQNQIQDKSIHIHS